MKATMETEDKSLAESYVQEFVLDHFEDVSVKRENGNGDDLTCIRSHSQRLPPMPITCGPQASPPSHLLTPPSQQAEEHIHPMMYAQQHLHGPQNMVMHHPTGGVLVNAMKGNGILMYPNTPGTPPDTPPISNSPDLSMSPAPHHFQEHHPHLHQLHPSVKQAGMMDEMVWPPHHLRGQEPLDLRPSCTGDLETLQSQWNNVLHLGVITGGKRMSNEYLHHQVEMSHLSPQPNRPMSVESNSMMSPMSCSGKINLSQQDIISDFDLVHLPVRDLNKKLQGLPKADVSRLKQRRRTLKNRGYAQNCRSKRVNQTQQLKSHNESLEAELSRVQLKLNRVEQERDLYKHRYEVLQISQRAEGPDGIHNHAGHNQHPPEIY